MSNVSEAAAALGRIRTERKARTSAENAEKARERLQDPEVSAEANRKRSEAQKARWERIRQEQSAQGHEKTTTEKKRPGRPRTRPVENTQEKRPRGRPKKQTPEGNA